MLPPPMSGQTFETISEDRNYEKIVVKLKLKVTC